ncbi:MAG: methyltransferase family protein [Rhodanobacteraceae bacterium]
MHPLIVASGFHATVLYVAMAVCFGPEWIGSFFQRSETGAVRRDRGSHVLLVGALVLGMFAAFFCANAFPQATLGWNPPLQFWFGIVLMFAGLMLRWYAIRVLGKFFTRDVATRAGQYVVEAGPYRRIRHPSYCGALLMFLGTGIAMTNWASLVAIVTGAAFGYGWRVHVEEHALCADLGDPYRDYMRRTRRFIPFVW